MASEQLEQVIGRMGEDAAFRRAVRDDLNTALASGGYALTDEEKATLIQVDAPDLGLDRLVSEGLTNN